MNLNYLYEYYAPFVGFLGGDQFNIMRPNYSQVDNTPVMVASGVMFRCDPTTGRFAEPRWEGLMYYDIFGQRRLLQPGDILVKTVPDSMTPPVTILGYYPLKTTSGFRTARQCTIIDSKAEAPNSILYSNVSFDWLGQGFPGSTLNRGLMDSLEIPAQRACMFTRPNITRQRTHLVETDLNINVTQPDGSVTPYQRTWIVDEIDFTGNLMVLTLRNK